MPTDAPIPTLLSLLHEPAVDHSGARRFRGEPVLAWTLRRLRAAGDAVGVVAILCWDDQLAAVDPVATAGGASVVSQCLRAPVPALDAVAAARRWADGWRGGLLGTSAFDAGYHGPAVREAADRFGAAAVLLVDPAAGLVDPSLIAAVVGRWREQPDLDFAFTPAAAGLGCMLLARPLVDRLAAAGTHPGRVLHYFPDQLSREPIAGDACAPTPAAAARSTYRY
ncbi:MAG: hypothetical protein JWO31_2064, partial [Phycisphaerales bacterium]|nr:hypothetical protein [Phycisphaerales bacterium]